MLANLIKSTQTINVNQGAAYSENFNMVYCSELSVQCVIDVAAAVVFPSSGVSTTNNTLTSAAAHNYWTGLKGQFTTSGGLPTGISALTNYWIVKVDATTVSVATSLANALAGTVVDITTAGTGNQTFTPTALSSGSISFQRTNIYDSSTGRLTTTAGNWDDIETATTVTADAHVWFTKVGPEWGGFRVKGSASDGGFQILAYVIARGEDKK